MSNTRTPTDRVDVCVVGAGPAGALAAHSLAKRGHDVVVLEAGRRFDPDSRTARMEHSLRPGHDPLSVWEMGGARDAYSSSGRPYPLNHSRVKGVGGTTLKWQGMVMRLHESDFTDWPIDYAALRPYYAGAETALGVAGAVDNPFAPPREQPFPLPPFQPSHSDSIFARACERLGIAMHSVPNARNTESYDGRAGCVGYGTCKPVCPSGAKYDATRHVEKAVDAGARVLDRVPVQRLEHDSDGTTVEAAVYVTPDGTTHRQPARQFLLACGGIETPRLLLLSDSELYPDGLANHSGAVGRYFMEHLYAGTGGIVDQRTRQHHVGFLTSETHQFYDDPSQGTDYLPAAEGERDDFTRLKLEFSNYAGPSPTEKALNSDQWGDALCAELREQYGHSLAMGGLAGQPPQKHNYVGLDRSTTDDHGNPVPKLHWTLDKKTKRTLLRANEIQATVLSELDADITWQVGPDNTGPAFHHMGTTRMGTDPTDSVVTPRLRTHDLHNLWIAGSSVFATSGAMNPTLTIAALALKAADHIHTELSRQTPRPDEPSAGGRRSG